MIRSKALRFVVPGVLALLMAGCQTPTAYRPAEHPGGPGYSDEQLASNRYRVTFTGNAATSRVAVENYLLLRAAEVTLMAGYHYFTFDTRNTQAQTTYRTDFEGWPGWPGYGWYWHSWAFGPPGATESYPVTRYEAYAEIIMLTDQQAANDPRAVNAQSVLDHIGNAIHSGPNGLSPGHEPGNR